MGLHPQGTSLRANLSPRAWSSRPECEGLKVNIVNLDARSPLHLLKCLFRVFAVAVKPVEDEAQQEGFSDEQKAWPDVANER